MTEANTVQIIALVGWLVLMGGAFASYKLSWKKSLTMVLAWVAIFAFVFVIFTWAGSGA